MAYCEFPAYLSLILSYNDLALDARGGRVFLLGQSDMPAQDFQVLANPGSPLNPRYPARNQTTPEWTRHHGDLKRFSERAPGRHAY